MQLIQAGSVKPATGDHFFAILEAAMSSLTACHEPSVRADYRELFTAAQDTIEVISASFVYKRLCWTSYSGTYLIINFRLAVSFKETAKYDNYMDHEGCGG